MADLVNESKFEEPQPFVHNLIARFLKKWNRDEFDTRAREIVQIITKDENWPRYSNGERIKCQISHRAKEEESLEKKLQKLSIQIPEARDKRLDVLQGQIDSKRQFIEENSPKTPSGPDEHTEELKALEFEHQRVAEAITTLEGICNARAIRDLAGVRILAYFPDDVPMIAQQVGKLFDILGKSYLKDAGKSRQPRKSDKFDKNTEDLDALKDLGLLEYAKGPFKQVSMDNVEKDWKHAGYRAIHFHVKRREDTSNKVDREEEEQQLEDPDLWRKRVEIQVSTSVMHAWSEVEHDLIYKNPWQLAPNMTIDRMVDAINGLAITSEILLQQLQSTFNKLRDDGEEVLTRTDQLMEWIIEIWPDSAKVRFEDDEKDSLIRYLGPFHKILKRPVIDKTLLTKKDIQLLMNSKKLISYLEAGFYKFDALDAVILEELSKKHASRKDFEEHDLVLDPEFPTSKIRWCYKILLAGIVYGICHGTRLNKTRGEWAQFPSLDKMKRINNILLGRDSLFDKYKLDQKTHELADYAQQVLDPTLNPHNAAAVAYAKLGFCGAFQLCPEVENSELDRFEGANFHTAVDFGFIHNEAIWEKWRALPPIAQPAFTLAPHHPDSMHYAHIESYPKFFIQVTELNLGEIQGLPYSNDFRLRFVGATETIPNLGNMPSLSWMSPHSIRRYLDFLSDAVKPYGLGFRIPRVVE